MKKKRNKGLKKTISLVMTALLIFSLAGCGNPGDKTDDGKSATPETYKNNGDNKEVTIKPSATPKGFTVQQSYTTYQEAKAELSSALTEALAKSPANALESLALLGVVTVDLAIMPASFLGLGQDAVATGLAILGMTDVKYTENGNRYTVTYKNQNGEVYEFQAKYDPAADALVCEVAPGSGDDGIYYEYRKTPFGYVGQTYTFGKDVANETYQISIHKNGGIIGIINKGKGSEPLTGNETKDFPKACPWWCAKDGTAYTGVTAKGEEFSFEYIAKE